MCNALDMSIGVDRQLIRNVLVLTSICQSEGRAYTGKMEYERGRPKTVINDNSIEQNIVANFRESSCSVTLITIVLNIHRFTNSLSPISCSAVYNCKQRMTHHQTTVEMQNQGNTNPNTDWAKANKAGTYQILL